MDFIISCALSDFNICRGDYVKMDKQQLINVLTQHVITDKLIMSRDVLVNIKQNKQSGKKCKKVRFKF